MTRFLVAPGRGRAGSGAPDHGGTQRLGTTDGNPSPRPDSPATVLPVTLDSSGATAPSAPSWSDPDVPGRCTPPLDESVDGVVPRIPVEVTGAWTPDSS